MGGGGFPDAPPADGTLITRRLPDEPATVDVEEGGRVRLRLINAAAAATYEIGIDDHELVVTSRVIERGSPTLNARSA